MSNTGYVLRRDTVPGFQPKGSRWFGWWATEDEAHAEACARADAGDLGWRVVAASEQDEAAS